MTVLACLYVQILAMMLGSDQVGDGVHHTDDSIQPLGESEIRLLLLETFSLLQSTRQRLTFNQPSLLPQPVPWVS